MKIKPFELAFSVAGVFSLVMSVLALGQTAGGISLSLGVDRLVDAWDGVVHPFVSWATSWISVDGWEVSELESRVLSLGFFLVISGFGLISHLLFSRERPFLERRIYRASEVGDAYRARAYHSHLLRSWIGEVFFYTLFPSAFLCLLLLTDLESALAAGWRDEGYAPVYGYAFMLAAALAIMLLAAFNSDRIGQLARGALRNYALTVAIILTLAVTPAVNFTSISW